MTCARLMSAVNRHLLPYSSEMQLSYSADWILVSEAAILLRSGLPIYDGKINLSGSSKTKPRLNTGLP